MAIVATNSAIAVSTMEGPDGKSKWNHATIPTTPAIKPRRSEFQRRNSAIAHEITERDFTSGNIGCHGGAEIRT